MCVYFNYSINHDCIIALDAFSATIIGMVMILCVPVIAATMQCFQVRFAIPAEINQPRNHERSVDVSPRRCANSSPE